MYSYWRSSCSWRVRIALAYKRIEYEYHAVNLIKDGGEQKQPAYAAINPSRLVPSLAIDGHVLAQSIAILEYLEESRPELPSLLPRDLFARAAVRAIVRRRIRGEHLVDKFAQVNTIAADTQPVQNLRVLNKVAEIGGDKTEWANHVSDDEKRGNDHSGSHLVCSGLRPISSLSSRCLLTIRASTALATKSRSPTFVSCRRFVRCCVATHRTVVSQKCLHRCSMQLASVSI